MIVGLRIVFEIPAELRSNWIFQLMLDPDGRECQRMAQLVILILVLPWLLAIPFPVYAYLAGWRVACLHTVLVVTWAVLLTNIVLIRFRKLPFTCTMPVFKQHSFVTLISVGFRISSLCCFHAGVRIIGTGLAAAHAWPWTGSGRGMVHTAPSRKELNRNRKKTDLRGIGDPNDRSAAARGLRDRAMAHATLSFRPEHPIPERNRIRSGGTCCLLAVI